VRGLAGGDPIPFIVVTVEVDGDARAITAHRDGRFTRTFATAAGVHRLAVEIPPSQALAAARVALDGFDVEKRPLDLQVDTREIKDGDAGVTVRVRASRGFAEDEWYRITARRGGEPDPDGAADLAITVRAGPIDAPLPALGTIHTDAGGEGELELALGALGGAGRKRVEVSFPGDAMWSAARAETTVHVASATDLELSLTSAVVSAAGRLGGHGRLSDAAGAGIAGAEIAIEGAGRRLVDLVTDRAGAYSFAIAASELGTGSIAVQAVFDPARSGAGAGSHLQPSRSPVRPVRFEPRRPVPVSLAVGAFVLTAAAIGAFVLLRTRPWERWLGRLRRAPAGPAAPSDARLPEGLTLARPGLVNTLRRAHDLGFTGVVRSAPSGQPLAGARVEVEIAGQAPAQATSAADGGFALEDLPPGEHQARVSAPGHVAVRFALGVPHRGELRGARVDLIEVREQIFTLYRAVAEPLLPRSDLWGIRTPREIVDGVRARRPAPALAALTDYVEEKYFSQRTPEEAELPEAARRVEVAREEQAAPPR
jgi:hypothetical protein